MAFSIFISWKIRDKNISFGYEVWGLAFILMKMWDSYLKIREEKIVINYY